VTRVPLLAALLLASCATGANTPGSTGGGSTTGTTSPVGPATSEPAATPGCADVIGATITEQDGMFTIAATVLSSDTGWDKYADAWQVRDATGEVIAERVLTHPHVDEQPFTRSLNGIAIPDGLAVVTIAARDSTTGFCGDVFDLEVPGR
jgi:hypothetical protein